jgi:hypothetical protein
MCALQIATQLAKTRGKQNSEAEQYLNLLAELGLLLDEQLGQNNI